MALTVPTVTGYSAFWETTGDQSPYAPITAAQLGMRSPIEKKLARLLKRNQLRDVSAAFTALIGAAAGGTATSTYKRVQAPTRLSSTDPRVTAIGDMGGLIDIETVTVINRATTSADETYLKDFFDNELLEAGITYPTVSGSGGSAYVGNQGVPGFSF